MKYVIPMFESERGWGSKIDGYTGPFDNLDSAELYAKNYNLKFNNEKIVPNYYIKALDPVPHTTQKCDYYVQEDLLQTNMF